MERFHMSNVYYILLYTENTAPYVNGTSSINIMVNETYIFQVEAGDTDAGDVATLTSIFSPTSGYSFDLSTGNVTWTPQNIDLALIRY